MSSILERGRFVRTCANPKSLAFFDENQTLAAALYQRFRFEWVCGSDNLPLDPHLREWVIIGQKGQLWEHGCGMLGITVEGTKWTASFIQQTSDFCTVSQNGSGEANLRCTWNSENVEKLAKLLKLRKRRTISSCNAPSFHKLGSTAAQDASGGSEKGNTAAPASRGCI